MTEAIRFLTQFVMPPENTAAKFSKLPLNKSIRDQSSMASSDIVVIPIERQFQNDVTVLQSEIRLNRSIGTESCLDFLTDESPELPFGVLSRRLKDR